MYQVVAGQLETFLARQQERDRAVPAFVEEEFRSYLRCGIKAYGFLRLHCDTCRKDRLLAFSCKGGRAFSPSCGGRRMADTAARLVDRDEMAAAGGKDPVELRRRLLSAPGAARLLSVLNLAAEKSGWASPCRPDDFAALPW